MSLPLPVMFNQNCMDQIRKAKKCNKYLSSPFEFQNIAKCLNKIICKTKKIMTFKDISCKYLHFLTFCFKSLFCYTINDLNDYNNDQLVIILLFHTNAVYFH